MAKKRGKKCVCAHDSTTRAKEDSAPGPACSIPRSLRNVNWARRKILHEERARRRNAEGGRQGGKEAPTDRPTDRRLRAFRVINERSYRRIKSANARSSSKRESEVSPSGNGESEAARLGRVKTTSASMQKRGEGSRGRGVREGRRQAELPFFSPQGKRESGIADKSARFDEKRAPSARQTE